jgi:hypothetical protein
VVPDVSKESVAFLFKVSVVHEEFLVGHFNDGKPIIQRDSNKSQTAGVFSLWPVCVKLMSLHLPDGRVLVIPNYVTTLLELRGLYGIK